ncbi:hypothetical protein Tco_1407041 [Tanacetum coccineum]
MIDADEQLAARFQDEEQEQFSIGEKSRMLVEMIAERKRFFAAQRAAEQRSKPPTKNQIRNKMCTYLKNMCGYKHNQLKRRSYEEIQKLFDKAYKQVSLFVLMDSEVVKSSVTRAEGSSKRSGDELEQEKAKKQKDDDDQEEEEMKKHMDIVQDDEAAIDAIPLATKPPVIVEWKIIKKGKMGYFQLIRADGSLKRYSSMIQMLQNIDREDLETLWKLIKTKHGNTRPDEAYERVLWGDLKVMFEPDIESKVWRSLEGHNVTVWKLFSSSGVHFVRFIHLHIFMLVEKKYPFTPDTITGMLNKKLQTDQWNEMCYQLLKLMTKQRKNPGSERIVGFKRLQDILRVTAAQVRILQKPQENGQNRTNTDTGTEEHTKSRENAIKSDQLKSTFGQPNYFKGPSTHGQDKTSPSTLIGGDPRKNDMVDIKETQGNGAYTLEVHTKEAQRLLTHGCHAGNPCALQSNPTAQILLPMIVND